MEFRKILVPIRGTEADDEAVRLACRLAKLYKSKIYAVYVITIKRSLPLEAEISSETKKAEELLDHIEDIAGEQGYEIDTDILQAREVGPTIIDEAVERSIDLILIGIRYKKHFGQFSLGNTVPYVLKNAPCRVILFQQ